MEKVSRSIDFIVEMIIISISWSLLRYLADPNDQEMLVNGLEEVMDITVDVNDNLQDIVEEASGELKTIMKVNIHV